MKSLLVAIFALGLFVLTTIFGTPSASAYVVDGPRIVSVPVKVVSWNTIRGVDTITYQASTRKGSITTVSHRWINCIASSWSDGSHLSMICR